MIRSSLVKGACVAIALLGVSASQAGAIEIQGSNPTAQLSEGMISKAYIAHRGATAVGPRGGVYHRGGTAVGGYRGGAYRRRGLSRRRLSRRGLSWRAASIAAATAAGPGPVGTAGARAARSRRAPRSGFSRPARPSPTLASRRRRAYAGITPIPATARASGTPASKLRAAASRRPEGPRLLFLGLVTRLRRSRIHGDPRSQSSRSGSYRDQSLFGAELHAEWSTRSYSSTASPIVAKKDCSPI